MWEDLNLRACVNCKITDLILFEGEIYISYEYIACCSPFVCCKQWKVEQIYRTVKCNSLIWVSQLLLCHSYIWFDLIVVYQGFVYSKLELNVIQKSFDMILLFVLLDFTVPLGQGGLVLMLFERFFTHCLCFNPSNCPAS